MQCYALLPRHVALLSSSFSEIVDCLLEEGHGGEHLSRLSDGRYIRRHPDDECTECFESGEEECDCFVWYEISEGEVQRILAGKPDGRD
jgi:hypothetical protein